MPWAGRGQHLWVPVGCRVGSIQKPSGQSPTPKTARRGGGPSSRGYGLDPSSAPGGAVCPSMSAPLSVK